MHSTSRGNIQSCQTWKSSILSSQNVGSERPDYLPKSVKWIYSQRWLEGPIYVNAYELFTKQGFIPIFSAFFSSLADSGNHHHGAQSYARTSCSQPQPQSTPKQLSTQPASVTAQLYGTISTTYFLSCALTQRRSRHTYHTLRYPASTKINYLSAVFPSHLYIIIQASWKCPPEVLDLRYTRVECGVGDSYKSYQYNEPIHTQRGTQSRPRIKQYVQNRT